MDDDEPEPISTEAYKLLITMLKPAQCVTPPGTPTIHKLLRTSVSASTTATTTTTESRAAIKAHWTELIMSSRRQSLPTVYTPTDRRKSGLRSIMYYYRPRLADGRIAPFALEIYLFYFTYNWPLGEDPTWPERVIKRLIMMIGFCVQFLMMESEALFVIQHLSAIDVALEGLCTGLLAAELYCRVIHMALNTDRFKRLLDDFFQQIYIERSADPQRFGRIQRKLLPTRLCTYSYLLTLFTYYSLPVLGIFSAQQLLPFPMDFHFDNRPLGRYLLTLAGAVWLGLQVVTHMGGEANLLATLILHLNARFQLLQRDLAALYDDVYKEPLNGARRTSAEALRHFRSGLIDIVRRNVELNAFATQLQEMYSFSIFIMMSLSAILLCVLGFKTVTVGFQTKNVTYILWIIGKIVELLVFGQLGSTLIYTTSQMGTMYYESNWEKVIMNSPDQAQNAELLKNINIAIALNQQPFQLSGLKYFSVRFETVVKILQGAGSYFTCLYAFR